MRFGYTAYGIHIQSDRAFPEFKGALNSNGSVLGSVLIQTRSAEIPDESELVWESLNQLAYGFLSTGKRAFIRSPFFGTIEVNAERNLIRWNPPAAKRDLGRVIVRGRALGLLLSYNPDCYLLHASALVSNGRAFALCGQMRQGKSTLSASLLNADNLTGLLSDDLVVISREADKLRVHSGPREIRLWPETLNRIGENGRQVKSETLHAQTTKRRCFVGQKSPWRHTPGASDLKKIYILARGAEKRVFLERLNGSEAILGLLANAYMSIVSDAAVSKRRLEWASEIAGEIPIVRLHYPCGFEYLDEVGRVILADLKKSRRAAC